MGKLKTLHTTASEEALRAATAEAQREFTALRADNDRWAAQADILYGYQKRGIALEREGKPEGAAEAYEAAVAYGRSADRMTVNQYFYSLDRLCVLYRRLRRYDDEVATIRAALAEFISPRDRERLAARLVKAQHLQERDGK